MILLLEIKKLKRTGCLPAFLGGAVLAAAFPLLNMLVRSETFTALPGEPFRILTDANWQMMAMLNILTIICGACMIYHTEYANNGAQKMAVLPVRTYQIFWGKFAVTVLALSGMLLFEIAALELCAMHWFPDYHLQLTALAKNLCFSLIAALPTIILMMLIASVCQNMWISLGIGVILVFTVSVFPKENLFLSLCPFNSPYQTLALAAQNGSEWIFTLICAAETIIFGIAAFIFDNVRRYFL